METSIPQNCLKRALDVGLRYRGDDDIDTGWIFEPPPASIIQIIAQRYDLTLIIPNDGKMGFNGQTPALLLYKTTDTHMHAVFVSDAQPFARNSVARTIGNVEAALIGWEPRGKRVQMRDIYRAVAIVTSMALLVDLLI
jgi:hypothetical protein